MANDRSNPGEREVRKNTHRRPGTVLIIDDDPAVRTAAANMLSRCGYCTVQADGGEQGLRIFSQKKSEIDLILLDLTMPILSGEETFHRLRRMRPQTRIVLMSGFDAKGVMDRLGGAGPDGFVQKPFTLSELRAAVAVPTPSSPLRNPPGRDLL